MLEPKTPHPELQASLKTPGDRLGTVHDPPLEELEPLASDRLGLIRAVPHPPPPQQKKKKTLNHLW